MATIAAEVPGLEGSARTGLLAISLQEAFTVAARLRASRQTASDAASFRAHVKSLLTAADRDARARGYDPEYVKLAIYAYIAFLDETVLNLSQPMFAEWTRQPLQEEVFGEHMAGENFFRYVADLLGRADSTDLADLLEVYLLCLLLGYHGKYGTGDPGGLQSVVVSVQQKIQRIRSHRGGIQPIWPLPQNETVVESKDPWIRRLIRGAIASAGVALLLFILYKLLLGGSASNVIQSAREIAGGN
jgi:type VI secretion system protein ImpK